ncbi:SRPBCC family protein [Streptomyces sp. NEAU-sy36]|uniref:SRPBCC family protein n=1 Tax=unclassified Streptomyces TaxID=2593676 RepID=UPI0015D5AFB9|nr:MULTISPECIES: SRPBCC family protein [unclassified Streptomyces]QLJ01899.1 SRPBCC family protein [Streptomyces sp. NEAU-sy36]
MPQRLRPVGPDFVGRAPVRLVFGRDIAAAPESVYQALAEDVAGLPQWFSAVTAARSTEGGREVRLRGGLRFRETVLVAEEPGVYAYRVDVTNAPGARAWVEEWRLTPAGTGTRVRLTFALDGTAAFRLGCRLAAPGVGGAVRRAIAALGRRLA